MVTRRRALAAGGTAAAALVTGCGPKSNPPGVADAGEVQTADHALLLELKRLVHDASVATHGGSASQGIAACERTIAGCIDALPKLSAVSAREVAVGTLNKHAGLLGALLVGARRDPLPAAFVRGRA